MSDASFIARPTLRTTRGEQRRDALLEALNALLAERPLQEISVGQIAEQAGLTRSAFYFYFASKEAAVTELLRDVFEEVVNGARTWTEGDGEPREALAAAMAQTMHLWSANRRLFRAMLDARDDPAVRDLWNSWVELFVEPLSEALEDERRQGRAPADGPDATTLIRLLLGMNESALDHYVRREPDEAQDAALAGAIAQTWLRAIYGEV